MGRFLQISMGSASELDYLILLAGDLGYLKPDVKQTLSADLQEIRRMLTVFYQRVRKVPPRPAIAAGC